MKLKNRMVISFFVIILVPLILTGVAVAGFTMYQVWSLEKKYGIEGVTYENLSNNTMLLSKMTQKTFSTLEKTASSDPEKLEETSYLNSLNQDLTGKNAYLLIRKGNDMFYCGSPTQDELLFSELPEYGDPSADNDRGVYIGADVQSLIKQVDFTFTDGVKGSAFIIFHSNSMVPQLKKILLDTVFVIILILILTALGLCTWTYRGVMTPLTQLKEATKNIKEGNLDFTIEKTGVDEIGDLCDDFEEMRKRLKESAEEKVAFDKENKELISNISHDLKTPITAVKGYVEGIMDGVADTPEKMDRYIRTIYNKANEMDRLINELTFYSKIDTNRIPYTFNKIHISDYFEDCVDELSVQLESSGVLSVLVYASDHGQLIAGDATAGKPCASRWHGYGSEWDVQASALVWARGIELGNLSRERKLSGAGLFATLSDLGQLKIPGDDLSQSWLSAPAGHRAVNVLGRVVDADSASIGACRLLNPPSSDG